jgi:RNA recognition motif. (a.k.a. RRM, RBD, or RNP domain)
VNQITSKVREKDLKKFFEACGGPVKNVIMLRDKATNRHRGFAYVEMRDLDAVSCNTSYRYCYQVVVIAIAVVLVVVSGYSVCLRRAL